ncbi:MAG TPA: hypothetical protein VLV86_23885 [Vicinamibacterales bacterium]|nr:hypothetical protein [Vicinamibacterales bacterium]
MRDHTVSARIRKLFTFPIDAELLKALRKVEARDGVSKAEQIRRGIRLWLKANRVAVKPAKRRARTRRKA